VLAQGEDIVPIPGTKHRKYIEENAAAVDLNLAPDLVQRLQNIPADAWPATLRAGDAGVRERLRGHNGAMIL